MTSARCAVTLLTLKIHTHGARSLQNFRQKKKINPPINSTETKIAVFMAAIK